MAPLVNRPQQKPGKKRKNNINLVFDEDKRKDFLGGFHKRKLQRQKEAKDILEKKLKEERKRLKHEARESFKKLVVSTRPIPDLEEMFTHEYETDDVTVKVTELTDAEIAKQNCWIGPNQPIYNTKEDEEEQELPGAKEEIAGMEMKNKPPTKKAPKKEKQEFKTAKDVKRAVKKQATKNFQKSKPFQLKIRLEKSKNKKKSKQKERLKTKLEKIQAKKKGAGKGKSK